MSKTDKTIEKLLRRPPPSDLKWDEIKHLLEGLGYEIKNGKGSRRKFYNKERDLLICCHEPHPSPDVDKGCIADIASHLIDNGLIEK
jgi:predicted RNA binding protein YcfA (HicA-like mRNA interferase family)